MIDDHDGYDNEDVELDDAGGVAEGRKGLAFELSLRWDKPTGGAESATGVNRPPRLYAAGE